MEPTGGARVSQYGNGCRYIGKRHFVICKCCCRAFCGCWFGVYRVSGGAEDCSAGFAFPGHMPTVSMPGKKNGHLPWGGVHKSAISRGHSESWFCRPVGPVAQGLGVPGASPRQEGLPWSYETMGRCRVPVRQIDGFWGRPNGTHLVFICSWDRLLGHRRIGSLVHQVSTSGHSGSSIRVGDSESEAVGVVGKAGKAGKAGRAGRAGRAGKGGKGKRRQQGLGDIEGSLVARRLIDSLGPGASDHS